MRDALRVDYCGSDRNTPGPPLVMLGGRSIGSALAGAMAIAAMVGVLSLAGAAQAFGKARTPDVFTIDRHDPHPDRSDAFMLDLDGAGHESSGAVRDEVRGQTNPASPALLPAIHADAPVLADEPTLNRAGPALLAVPPARDSFAAADSRERSPP